MIRITTLLMTALFAAGVHAQTTGTQDTTTSSTESAAPSDKIVKKAPRTATPSRNTSTEAPDPASMGTAKSATLEQRKAARAERKSNVVRARAAGELQSSEAPESASMGVAKSATLEQRKAARAERKSNAIKSRSAGDLDAQPGED